MKGMDGMASAKNKNGSLAMKKIVIILCVIVGIVLLTLYFKKWQEVREDEKYLSSYLISTNTVNLEMNDIKEINSVLSETPSSYFIYISYTKDKDVYNLEKKLKPLIDDYNLQNSFYYINVTNIKENNKDYKEDIAHELNIDKDKIKKVPIILYFKDGKLVQNGVYNEREFEKLLKEQDIDNM